MFSMNRLHWSIMKSKYLSWWVAFLIWGENNVHMWSSGYNHLMDSFRLKTYRTVKIDYKCMYVSHLLAHIDVVDHKLVLICRKKGVLGCYKWVSGVHVTYCKMLLHCWENCSCYLICYIYLWHIECNVTDLGITTGGGRVDPKCANGGFSDSSSFSEGVICYNGITVGSTAVYICDNGFVLVGNEARVCQSNGSWNGRTPQCISGTYS